jgi:hypothetical protein
VTAAVVITTPMEGLPRPPGRAMSVTMAGKIIAYMVMQASFVARQGSRVGWIPVSPVSPVGRSAMTSASSAYVRDACTCPSRASNSSSVSRPSTNATFSAPITCSRSAWDARRRPRSGVAATSSPSPAITGTSPTSTMEEAYPGYPPAVIPRRGLNRVFRRGGREGPSVRGAPDQDTWFRLSQRPALGLLAAMMMAT